MTWASWVEHFYATHSSWEVDAKKHQGWKGTITNNQDQSGIPCLIEN